MVIFLSEINNPSNLGAIFRTAEAAGAAGIIISPDSADVFSTKAIRSAMGANLRLPACENVAIEEVLAWAAKKNLVPTAADISGGVSYTQIDWKVPRLLIFGSEAHGLNDAERDSIEEVINIPMENGVESLNLAVACGIVLFEAKRQARFLRSYRFTFPFAPVFVFELEPKPFFERSSAKALCVKVLLSIAIAIAISFSTSFLLTSFISCARFLASTNAALALT